jgi:hypothetical protein
MTVFEQAQPAEAVPNAVPEPESRSAESASVVAVVMDFVGATLSQFDQLLESMRLSPHGPGLTGSLFQWSRDTPDGVRVTEVWQSYDHFEAFLSDEIEPRLSAVGMREPDITTYEVHSYLTQGPTIALSGDNADRDTDASLDSRDQSGLLLGADDARVVVDYAVGAFGVGPVMGIDSDDFFPSVSPSLSRSLPPTSAPHDRPGNEADRDTPRPASTLATGNVASSK